MDSKINLKVPKELYLYNRKKLLSMLPKENAVIMLEGGGVNSKYNTDREYKFEQESNFRYLFGINKPDCVGLIEVINGRSIILLPTDMATAKYTVVNGNNVDARSINKIKEKFGIDVVQFNNEQNKERWTKNKSKVYTINDLENLLVECRVTKSPYEFDLMRKVNVISSRAHSNMMAGSYGGIKEYQLENEFVYCLLKYGVRDCAYLNICASGQNSSVLHYTKNNKTAKANDLVLADMGGQVEGYAADITTTFPAGGKFTEQQADIYKMVLNTLDVLLKTVRPGMDWNDLIIFCNFMITHQLLRAGFIKGDIPELMKNKIYFYFMPHRLGHFIGLDVHDVGNIEKTHNILTPGMAIAIEPGIYFNKNLFDIIIRDPNIAQFLNIPQIEQYYPMGGIRLESNLLVHDDHVENITNVPRTIKDVETVLCIKAGR